MKKDIHPKEYRLVAFKDISTGFTFITKSTASSKQTITVEGVSYPLIKMDVSSDSHPFYTGSMKLANATGRIEKFNKKYAKFYKTKPQHEDNAS